jgi:nucleoside-diphosphate-sugar epimerase
LLSFDGGPKKLGSLEPTNLYGPGDNYHPEKSHVIPALLRRFHEAKLSGAPRKLMDNTKLKNMGWQPEISLKDGLRDAYQWYVDNIDTARR